MVNGTYDTIYVSGCKSQHSNFCIMDNSLFRHCLNPVCHLFGEIILTAISAHICRHALDHYRGVATLQDYRRLSGLVFTLLTDYTLYHLLVFQTLSEPTLSPTPLPQAWGYWEFLPLVGCCALVVSDSDCAYSAAYAYIRR